MHTRRFFLKGSAIAMIGAGAAPAWLARAAASKDDSGKRRKVLVAIFQRGAADGLNIVVPHGEQRYYDLRPTIAVPKKEILDLDGFFGLHPNLSALKPMWDSRQLAIVEAAGSPDPTRSHFDAQDFMESGTPGLKATRDVWLNRALPPAASPVSPVRAISLGANTPRSLRGKNAAVAVNNIGEFQVRDTTSSTAFESMYSGTVDKVLGGAGKDAFEAVRILHTVQKQSYTPANGASYPAGRFGQVMQQIARLIKADVGVEVAFGDIGGWDTHVNEIGANVNQGALAQPLREFGQALGAFYADMGDRMEDIVVVTMSEFGRTAKENGNRGTDHGHANVMFAMGGGVRGGKVYGKWPGLEQEQLYEDRDLALTTDFRDVLGEMVSAHLGNTKLDAVFPGYKPEFRGLLKG